MDKFPENYECVLFDGAKGYLYLSPLMQPLSYRHQRPAPTDTMSLVNSFGVTEFLMKSPSGRYALQLEEVGDFGTRIAAQFITVESARKYYSNATKLVSPNDTGMFDGLENF